MAKATFVDWGEPIRLGPILRETHFDPPEIQLHRTLIALRELHLKCKSTLKERYCDQEANGLTGADELYALVDRHYALSHAATTKQGLLDRFNQKDPSKFIRWSTDVYMRLCMNNDHSTQRVERGLNALAPVLEKLQKDTIKDDSRLLEKRWTRLEPQRFREIHAVLIKVFDLTRQNLRMHPDSQIGIAQLEEILDEIDFVLLLDGNSLKQEWTNAREGGDRLDRLYGRITSSACVKLFGWKNYPRLENCLSLALEAMPLLEDQEGLDSGLGHGILRQLWALNMGWLVRSCLDAVKRIKEEREEVKRQQELEEQEQQELEAQEKFHIETEALVRAIRAYEPFAIAQPDRRNEASAEFMKFGETLKCKIQE